MKNLIYLCLLFVSLLLIGCSQKSTDGIDTLICLDLEKNSGFKNQENLKPRDLKIIQLDGTDKEAFFKSGKILDVVGDTIFISDNDFFAIRILMFSLSTGKYLGDINHQGEGPGEYRFIFGAFIDSIRQSVLMPDIDRPYVYEYSLKADTLIKTYNRPDLMLRLQPTGNIETGVNFGEPKEDGLSILQCNSKFEVTDSIRLKDMHVVSFINFWAQSGVDGIIFDNDSLFVVSKGHLTPVVYVNLGKHRLKEKEARETIERLMHSDEPDSEYLKRLDNYMIIKDFQFTDENILVTYIYGNHNYSDLYDIRNGQILHRFESEKDFNGSGRIVLDFTEGNSIVAEKLFTKDRIWYGITEETDTVGFGDFALGNSQVKVVSFKL